MAEARGRFAPSTTGRAHPGTLLAALLCWLDARSRGAEVLLRLEDLDRARTKAGYSQAMETDLEAFGLDWDGVSRQSEHQGRYVLRIQALVDEGRIYACQCSRATIRASGVRAPDESFRYPGTCRDHVVEGTDWRTTADALRVRLDDARIDIRDESGIDLSGNAAELFGDPLVRRRDGAYAYHLVSVVDDEADGIGRVVRGRDLAPSTTLQAGLRRLFGFSNPVYRHHPLLLESRGGKLSKLHGAVDVVKLGQHYDTPGLVGRLASLMGLVPDGARCLPSDLVADFDWARVSVEDIPLEWSLREGLQRVKPG